MRMWKVNPRVMCRRHLLGEHLEMHMFVGAIWRGRSLQGFIDNSLVETHHIVARHDELVDEMTKRGYNHQSPIEEPIPSTAISGHVDVEANLVELARRCPACRELQHS
jgi:hypothetical protein